MSELLREVARSLRREAQTSSANHCAVLVLALRDDGSYESLCWADEDAAEAAIRELPRAAIDMAGKIAGEAGFTIRPPELSNSDEKGVSSMDTPAPVDLMAAERMTMKVIRAGE